MMDMNETQEGKSFLQAKTRTELESDLERCLERKRNLEEEKNSLHNLNIDLQTMLKQRENELSLLRSQSESVQSKSKELEGELDQLRGSRSQDQGAIRELNQKILDMEKENREAAEENARIRIQVEQCEHDKETYRAYSDEAEKLIEVKTGKLLADMRELKEMNEWYKSEIAEKDRKISEYEERIEQITREKEILEKRIAARKEMQGSREEFVSIVSGKVEELQALVREFKAPEEEKEEEKEKGPGREIGIEEKFEKEMKEGMGLEMEKEIQFEEKFEKETERGTGEMGGGIEELEKERNVPEPGMETLLAEPEQIGGSRVELEGKDLHESEPLHVEGATVTESPETWREKLWEEPKKEAEKGEPEIERKVKSEERFPWEENEEEFSWEP